MELPFSIRLGSPSNVSSVYSLNGRTDYYDLTMVFSGQLHYNVDGIDYILKKRDALLIRPGSMRIRYADNNPAHYFSINFYSSIEDDPTIPTFVPNCSPALKDALFFCQKTYEKHSNIYRAEKCSLAVQILLLTLREEHKNSMRNPHVRSIVHFISENFTRPLSLEEIADSVFLTVPYCCHLVKKELNTTIYDLITRERVLLAKDYIISGEQLKEIPFLCGFNDYSHFYRSFKKHTGISPSQFK